MSIKFRDYRQEDGGFVFPTILRSYRFKNPIATSEGNSEYNNHLTQWLKLFTKKSARIVVACADDDENLIIGFIICNPKDKVVYYTYVKAAFRTAGIATSLLGYCGLNPKIETVFFTHWTSDVLHFSNKWRLIYNPYLFRWPKFKEEVDERAARKDFESPVSYGTAVGERSKE